MDDLTIDETTEVVGRYHGGIYAGSPAITMHCFGAGCVIYVGTSLDSTVLNLLMPSILGQASISAGITMPNGASRESMRWVHY